MNRYGLACVAAVVCGCSFHHGDSAAPDAGDPDAPPSAVTVGFSAATSMTDESQAASLAVQLSAASADTVTVAYAVTGGTATSSDAAVAGTTITFMPGETAKTLPITVANDTLDEPDETLTITLSDPVNATLTTATASTLTIIDDDSAPTIAFAQAAAKVTEAATTVSLTVQLSTASGFAVSAPFTVTGTADNPDDYTIGGAASMVTIPAGATSATIAVNVKSDSLDEANETVTVALGTPTHATAGAVMSQTLTIDDNDDAPSVALTSSGLMPDEGNNTITVTIQLSDISGQDVTIPYSIDASSTATEGPDYTIAAASPLVIPAGSTTTALTIAMKEDSAVEPDETVIVMLGTPTNASLANPTVYTLVIRNDD